MKVFELVNELIKRPCNDEVMVMVASTVWVKAESFEVIDSGMVGIEGGPALIIDADGNEFGTTEEIAAGDAE